jgi:hypothetical protein
VTQCCSNAVWSVRAIENASRFSIALRSSIYTSSPLRSNAIDGDDGA